MKLENFTVEKTELAVELFSHLLWRHRIQLNNTGLTTPGYLMLPGEWEMSGLPIDLKGKSFLDVGSNDGYFSFTAEMKGAQSIFACDIYHGDGSDMKMGWTTAGIESAKRYLDSRVEIKNISIYNLMDIDEVFDVVFCSDVLSWLTDPLTAIRNLASRTNEKLIIRDGFLNNTKECILRYEEKSKLQFTASLGFITEILKEEGFKKIQIKRMNLQALHEWQMHNFVKVFSSAPVSVWNHPFEGKKEIGMEMIDAVGVLSVNGYIYIYEKGWVNADQVKQHSRITSSIMKQLIKKNLKKIPVLSHLLFAKKEVRNIESFSIIAER